MIAEEGRAPLGTDSALMARRVAIVGASDGDRDYWSFNARLTRSALSGQFERVYLVNHRQRVIAGQQTYPSLSDIDDSPDLVFIAVPGDGVRPVLEECVAVGAPNCWIISGNVKPEVKEHVRELCSKHSLRVAGPNCIGYVNNVLRTRAYASGEPPAWTLGRLAVISQSGGVAASIEALAERKCDFSHIITTGDEVDLTAEDFLEYLVHDESTGAVAMFVEEFRQPMKFRQLAREAARCELPIFVISAGRSESGQRAAFAHTGALAGQWADTAAALASDAVTLCDSPRELVDFANVWLNTPRWPARRDVAVFTSSGAMGALACDYSNERKLDLPELARLDRSPLRSLVRSSAVTWNPLDSSVAGGTTKILGPYLDELLSDEALGAVIVMHTGPVYADQIAQILAASRRDGAGRLVVCWPGAPLAARSLLRETGVPLLEDAPLAFAAVDRLLEWADALPAATTQLARQLEPALRRSMLPYLDSRKLLTAAQIPGPKYRVVNSMQELADFRAAEGIAGPVVLKAASGGLHKAAAGQLRLDIRTDEDARRAFEALAPHGSLVAEEQIIGGVELLVDARRSAFGEMLTLGLGGVHANELDDVATVAATITPASVIRALSLTRAGRVLASTTPSAGRVMEAVSQVGIHLVTALRDHDADEIEVNPLAVTNDGCFALDARVIVADQGAGSDRAESVAVARILQDQRRNTR
jgi:acetate---CoA ligase (ADP-forming)